MQSESLPLPEVEFIEFGTDQWKQKLFESATAPAVSESFIGQHVTKFDGRNAAVLNSQKKGLNFSLTHCIPLSLKAFSVHDYSGV